MEWKEVFTVDKPVLAMLHLMGSTHADVLERAKKETDLLFEAGVDAVIVEDYFGDVEDVEAVLQWLQKVALLKKGYSIRNVAKLTGKAVSTIQQVKKDFISS